MNSLLEEFLLGKEIIIELFKSLLTKKGYPISHFRLRLTTDCLVSEDAGTQITPDCVTPEAFFEIIVEKWRSELLYIQKLRKITDNIFVHFEELHTQNSYISEEFLQNQQTIILDVLWDTFEGDKMQKAGNFCSDLISGFDNELYDNIEAIICYLSIKYTIFIPENFEKKIIKHFKKIRTGYAEYDIIEMSDKICNFISSFWKQTTYHAGVDEISFEIFEELWKKNHFCSIVLNTDKIHGFEVSTLKDLVQYVESDYAMKTIRFIDIKYDDYEFTDGKIAGNLVILTKRVPCRKFEIKRGFRCLDYLNLIWPRGVDVFSFHSNPSIVSGHLLTRDKIERLAELIRMSFDLKKLKCMLEGETVISQALDLICSSLMKHKNLIHLTLAISSGLKGEDWDQPLINALSILKKIKKLKLDFSGNNYIENKHIKNIIGAIINLKALKEIILNFGAMHCAILPISFAQFPLALETKPYIEVFELFINTKLDNSFVSLLAEGLKFNLQLTKLTISSMSCICNLSDEGFKKLMNTILKMKFLTYLHIDLLNQDSCTLTNESLAILGEIGYCLKKLNFLKLSLLGTQNKFTDEGFNFLTQITNLEFVKRFSLSLNFGNIELTESKVEINASTLNDNLMRFLSKLLDKEKLASLKIITVKSSGGLTQPGIINKVYNFFETIFSLENVQEFDVTTAILTMSIKNKTISITSTSLNLILSNILKTLLVLHASELTNLVFNFSNNQNEFTDYTIQMFRPGIAAMSNLTSCRLQLNNGFNKITNAGLQNIGKSIEHLDKLKSLRLECSGGMHVIDDNGLKNLTKCLHNNESLNDVHVDLRNGFNKITKKCVEDCSKIIKDTAKKRCTIYHTEGLQI